MGIAYKKAPFTFNKPKQSAVILVWGSPSRECGGECEASIVPRPGLWLQLELASSSEHVAPLWPQLGCK